MNRVEDELRHQRQRRHRHGVAVIIVSRSIPGELRFQSESSLEFPVASGSCQQGHRARGIFMAMASAPFRKEVLLSADSESELSAIFVSSCTGYDFSGI